MQLRKAERKKAKLKIGVSGPSGSGKTYSALLLASGLTSWKKIAMIDTENGSGELYSDLGAYNVIKLEAPFTPERYMEAIKACEDAGMEVIIIDSITHEWDGNGGCLEIQEKLGGRYQDWAKVTPRHKNFINSILQSKCHVITSVRNKQDYAMSADSNGKMKVEKLGLKEVTREGFEYELTLNFDIDIRHNANAGKDRTGLFMDKPEFTITAETGKMLLDWSNSGVQDVDADKLIIKHLCDEIDPLLVSGDQYEKLVKEKTELELKPENFDEIINRLTAIKEESSESQTKIDDKIDPPAPVKPEAVKPVEKKPKVKPATEEKLNNPALQAGKEKMNQKLAETKGEQKDVK